ncbi:MAG: hypothetical protein MJA82_06315 [Clostridia bacterium]|nr:hypothetical protein [Clostridia bacterium]
MQFDRYSQKLIVYLYNNNGMHSPKITIKNSISQVASFIKITEKLPQIIIADTCDIKLLNTMYGFIDICTDEEYLNKLLPILVPIQKGKQEPIKIEILDWGTSDYDGYNNHHFMIPYIERHFKINLKDKCI